MKKVQPIRDTSMIAGVKSSLMKKSYKYYIMFTIGINTGLRVSDILSLKVSDVSYRSHIIIKEMKTDKIKRFLINAQLQKELQKYIKEEDLMEHNYLIYSNKGNNKPIGRVQAYRVLHEAAVELGLVEIGTHTMRKTFGYWHYKQYKDVAILQTIFNHSSPSITLAYIGITDDMMDDTIKSFFL